eukprot:3280993-Pyramimonas_sp.AAC.1
MNGPFEMLRRQDHGGPLWALECPRVLRVQRLAPKLIGVEVMPRRAGNSGPSWDMLRGVRTPRHIQKEGRQVSTKSLVRYEKHRRLATQLSEPSKARWAHFGGCEARVGECALGSRSVEWTPL